jgi:hypothetical protein
MEKLFKRKLENLIKKRRAKSLQGRWNFLEEKKKKRDGNFLVALFIAFSSGAMLALCRL